MSYWNCLWTALLGALLAGAFLSGCEHSKQPRTSLFQQAEQHYERGEYDAALDDYQAFLQRFPRSPLAETARLRVRSINREVQSMMQPENMPKPEYLHGRRLGGPEPTGGSAEDKPSEATDRE